MVTRVLSLSTFYISEEKCYPVAEKQNSFGMVTWVLAPIGQRNHKDDTLKEQMNERAN